MILSTMVFLIGTTISVWLLTHIKQIIEISKWVVPRSSTLGFVALCFFAISIPKFNKLIIDFTEKKLEISSLKKEIASKKTQLAAIETRIESFKNGESEETYAIAEELSSVMARLKKEEDEGNDRVQTTRYVAKRITENEEYFKNIASLGFNIEKNTAWVVNYPVSNASASQDDMYLIGTDYCEISRLKLPPNTTRKIIEALHPSQKRD